MAIVIGMVVAGLLVYVGGWAGVTIGLGLALGLAFDAWDRTRSVAPARGPVDRAEAERTAHKLAEYAEAWHREHPPDQKG